jgi:hypothetical protein
MTGADESTHGHAELDDPAGAALADPVVAAAGRPATATAAAARTRVRREGRAVVMAELLEQRGLIARNRTLGVGHSTVKSPNCN